MQSARTSKLFAILAVTVFTCAASTSGQFDNVSNWVAFDPGVNGVGNHPEAFNAGVFDGRHIYFALHFDFIRGEEEIPRFDTEGIFDDLTSWDVFDPIGAGVGSGVGGRSEAIFDGRYVYFLPSDWIEPHGEVVRYDTFVDCNSNGIQDECDLECGESGGWCDMAGCGLSVDVNENGMPDECEPSIPTVSEWGLMAMALLLMTVGTLVLVRKGHLGLKT